MFRSNFFAARFWHAHFFRPLVAAASTVTEATTAGNVLNGFASPMFAPANLTPAFVNIGFEPKRGLHDIAPIRGVGW